jgi:8-oxo-dGTP diphosphatase
MITTGEIEGFNKRFDVVSAFIEHDGQILLLHRQDHKPQGNTWAVVAGKVDAGEALDAAIVREIGEELGLTFATTDVRHFESYNVRYDEYDFAYHVFHLPVEAKPEVKLNLDEHKDYRWITPRDALTLPLIQDEDYCIKRFYNIDSNPLVR